MREVGETIVRRAHYAARRLRSCPASRCRSATSFFKEFPVCFDAAGKTVAEVNEALLAHGIFGGRDLSNDYPQLGQSALYCVTELHMRGDIDRLCDVLAEVLS